MTVPAPCPDCGESLGGRYTTPGGAAVCWPCGCRRTGLGPLPAHDPKIDPEWAIFRRMIADALYAIDKWRFVYIDQNTVVGACPLCLDGRLRVFFHGTTPAADLQCSLGCAELDIAHAIPRRRAAR
jgi:hypothetical protein